MTTKRRRALQLRSIALVLVSGALGGLLAGATVACRSSAPASGSREPVPATRWHCPMHPTIVSDRPGECPICHMTLVPERPDEGLRARGSGTGPVSPGGDGTARAARGTAPAGTPGQPQGVPGLAPVHLSPGKRQLIGVKTAPVARAPFIRTIRAVGRVAVDETRLRHIHTKVPGTVEALHANATGERVREGAPLLEIYSAELLASQQEYLVALRARERTAGSALPSVAGSGDELAASARRRLELLDLTDAQIEELERTGKARRTITLFSPISGTILQRMVTQGERIEPGMTLLDIADLSRVWVIASVYEYEMPFVRPGQPARMRLSYLPGTEFAGRVGLVYPTLEAATRTVQVRVEFDNPDRTLKPDMYAEVELVSALGERLSVPETAILQTGDRDVAFVDTGDGVFEPRQVRIGIRLPDRYEVLSGLAEGERVLASANFFVDSESRLKAAFSAATEGGTVPPAPSGPQTAPEDVAPAAPPAPGGHHH